MKTTMNYDVVIVVFNDHTFDGITTLSISNHKVVTNTELVLVGYGVPTDVTFLSCYPLKKIHTKPHIDIFETDINMRLYL